MGPRRREPDPHRDGAVVTANERRRAVRVTTEHLVPGTYVAAWNDHFAAHRLVRWTLPADDDTVFVQWGDWTVTRHARWSVWHRLVR